MRPLQGEADFTNWERRICRQLEAFDLWKYIEGIVLVPTPQEDEDQDNFVESLRIYKMEKNQAIHLLENAIYNDVFSTL